MRQLDADYRLGKNVKISMLYLEDDDAVAAEQYIKKASSLIAGCKQPALELQYRSCYVRILDAKRRFVEAAQRYYEISQMQTQQVRHAAPAFTISPSTPPLSQDHWLLNLRSWASIAVADSYQALHWQASMVGQTACSRHAYSCCRDTAVWGNTAECHCTGWCCAGILATSSLQWTLAHAMHMMIDECGA